jgi:DNA-directed RNA polymerase subunit RPC12/RpoP
MNAKWIKCFIASAGVILLAAALMRFLIASGNAQVLSLPEPVLGISLRYAVLLVGGFELIVALICLFGKRVGLQIGWLAWLATNYVVFWIGLFAMHCQLQGTCLGSLTDPLRLSRGIPGTIIAFVPVYLVIGSYATAFWLLFSKDAKAARQLAAEQLARQRDADAGLLKMPCPSCGVHIKFAIQNLGQKISCPHCKAAIILRKPENLKMTCFLCGGHVEFPSYAVGQKIPCPHCNRGITLMEPA